MTPLRALTLWPEWAFAIHHLGKRVENRTWKIPKDEWIMLHAGKQIGGRASELHNGIHALRYMAAQAGWTSSWHGHIHSAWTIQFSHSTHTCTSAHDPSAVPDACNPILTSHILGAFRVTHHDMPFKGDISGWRVLHQVGNVFDYRPLATPVPCKGAQGLWHVPDEVRAQFTWP